MNLIGNSILSMSFRFEPQLRRPRQEEVRNNPVNLSSLSPNLSHGLRVNPRAHELLVHRRMAQANPKRQQPQQSRHYSQVSREDPGFVGGAGGYYYVPCFPAATDPRRYLYPQFETAIPTLPAASFLNQHVSARPAGGDHIGAARQVVNVRIHQPPVQRPNPKRPHATFRKVKAHTAKCDACGYNNKSTLYRCTDCAYQVCTPCWDKTGGAHTAERPYEGKRFKPGQSGGESEQNTNEPRTQVTNARERQVNIQRVAVSNDRDSVIMDLNVDVDEPHNIGQRNVITIPTIDPDQEAQECPAENNIEAPVPKQQEREPAGAAMDPNCGMMLLAIAADLFLKEDECRAQADLSLRTIRNQQLAQDKGGRSPRKRRRESDESGDEIPLIASRRRLPQTY
jgi:hypothetical protein